jgi:hypothetical protein
MRTVVVIVIAVIAIIGLSFLVTRMPPKDEAREPRPPVGVPMAEQPSSETDGATATVVTSSERPVQSRPHFLIVTEHQVEYQLLPKDHWLASQREEVIYEFERLYESEQRRGVIVEQKEPFVKVNVPILNQNNAQYRGQE